MIHSEAWARFLRKEFKNRSCKQRDQLESLLEEYETACLLSEGPDPGRANHWGDRAIRIVRRLGEFTARPLHEFVPPTPPRKVAS